MRKERYKVIIIFCVLIFLVPFFSVRGSFFPEKDYFFIEPSFDKRSRGRTEGELVLVTNYIYFYIESSLWEKFDEQEKREYRSIMYSAGNDFERNTYPWVLNNFGRMPSHDIVGGRERMAGFFHSMTDGSGGYFRKGDQYSKYQYPRSNEGNILYLNASLIEDDNLGGYIAHEYVHLVTFNEKTWDYQIEEEIWLDELRAEMIISILGYDDTYEGSNLEERKRTFLRSPSTSLTQWKEEIEDYGVVNIFGQYLLDHYGDKVLSESMNIDIVGIPSIDYALSKIEAEKTFSQIFTDWKVAVYLNDCSYKKEYCFKNEHLEDLKVSPTTFFVSSERENPFFFKEETTNWAGNWYKITGDKGDLTLRFDGEERFVVPYALCGANDKCKLDYIALNRRGEGELVVENFNTEYESLIVMPSMQGKFRGFNGPEDKFSFTFEIEIERKEETEREKRIRELRERIHVLRGRVEELYFLIKGEDYTEIKIVELEEDLYFGMTNSSEVKRLQKFLKKQGEEIYPEGLITGNFYQMTENAVIRFQEKYSKEILDPLNLSQGTGYVGSYTRKKINSLIGE